MKKLITAMLIMVFAFSAVFGGTVVSTSAIEEGPVVIEANDGSNDGSYDSIQEAINAAKDGDTIIIAAGTYDESIVVPGASVKNITILGANSEIVPSSSEVDGTIITGGMTFGRDISTNPTIEKSVTVKGITFSGGSGLSFKDIRNVTVENNKFIDITITSGNGAITVLDPSNHDRAGVTTIKNNFIDGVAGSGLGIYVRRPALTTVIENNHVENTDHNSIQVVGVSEGPDVTINENTLINWDQNRDEAGGRAMRINFNPVDANTALAVTGNTFEPNDNLSPTDPDYVKITGVSTDDNSVDVLIESLVWQNTWPIGTNYSTVILVNKTAGPELPYTEEGTETITIEQGESVTLTVEDEEQEEINAVIPIEFLQYLLDNKLDIIIDTPYGTLNIPAELLTGLGSDVELKFAFSSSVDSTVLAIEELAGLMSEAGISENLEGKNAVAIGLPINITSTISDVGGTITIPLADADYDEAVTYYIFVEHSDGAEEVITGEVVDFGEGKGIQFTVDYFSTFTIFALEDEVPEETTETTTTTETSQDETTAETTAPEQTSEQPDATTEPTDMVQESVPKTGESTPYVPYLVFLGLGLIFAVSLKIRMYVRQKSNK